MVKLLSCYLRQIEKNNCLVKMELASGKRLKSCKIFLKVVFLVEWVQCIINVWIIYHSYGTSTNWRMHLRHT